MSLTKAKLDKYARGKDTSSYRTSAKHARTRRIRHDWSRRVSTGDIELMDSPSIRYNGWVS